MPADLVSGLYDRLVTRELRRILASLDPRRTDNKSCLTVLDFIGGANRGFRFDLRFRALLGGHRSDLIRQIEEGFPRLPSGCTIQLDRVATNIVLENVKKSVGSNFAGLVAELRTIADDQRQNGVDPSGIALTQFLHDVAGTHVILFVRHRKDEAGRTSAYTCLGAANYVSHQGSRPISITWQLRKPMPDDFFREAKVAAG